MIRHLWRPKFFSVQLLNTLKPNNGVLTTKSQIRHDLCTARIMGDRTTGAKVYVTRRVPERGLELLRGAGCQISQWDSDDPVPREELLAKVGGMDVIFCLLTDKIDAAVLDAAGKSLKVVGTMSVGYDHVELAACKERDIPVGYTPGVLTNTTAELTVSLLLAAARRLPEGMEAVKSGEWGTWKPLWMCGVGLADSTVGIVGLGRIGLAVARNLRNFCISRLLYTGRSESPHAGDVNAEYTDIDTLLKESDFVVVTCALTPETQGMFNKSAFAKMKKKAIFVNTSRGGLVNQEDLYDALSSGGIRAAGLDVTTPEPLPTDHPLLKLPNCIVLPHIASATEETRQKMSELTARNIIATLEGKPMPAQVQIP